MTRRLPQSILQARLASGQPNMELINWAQGLGYDVQQLQSGGGLPALISAIAALSPAANTFLRFTGAASVEALTAAQVKTALAIAAGDVSGLGDLAVLNTITLSLVTDAGALAAGDAGSDVPVSGFSGLLSGQTDVQSALDVVDALSLPGGLVLEDESEGDGGDEFLQVTATSTPSSVKRMECFFKHIVPEVDDDTLLITAILDDDSEANTNEYDYQFFQEDTTTFTSGQSLNAAFLGGETHIGTGSGEYMSARISLMSTNGSQSIKHFLLEQMALESDVTYVSSRRFVYVTTTKSVKGFRLDTNNAGDMINEGTAELWVQT